MSTRRVGLALAVPVVLIAGAVFATANVQRNAALLGARRQVASQALLTAMLDQETGARGYFQTRQPAFLQPWVEGTAAFTSSLHQLGALVYGDPVLRRMLARQAQIGYAWHATAQTAITTLGRGGRPQSVAGALRSKGVMDSFRAAHAGFDSALSARRNHSLSVATTIAVTIAVALAALLSAAGVLLTRRMAGREAARQRDQSELRDLLQASESELESRTLLIRHIEKLLPGASAAVFNRNNSDDRLEVTRSPDVRDSPLCDIPGEQMRPRACMAVRLSRSHDRRRGDEGLLRCEICGAMEGASACEPLLVGGQVIGSVLVVAGKPVEEERRSRLRESVAQAAPIIANQRNLMLAETRAASDALTGLPNRRAADETLKRLAAHAGRAMSPLAAVLLDLDHFKELNDRYGHEAGDKALALVGRIISSTVRGSDFAARFGGEEFLILLPDTDREGAVVVAEKLRGEIERADVSGAGPVTSSLGVAVLPTDALEPDQLLRRADHALYAAKASGRNCTTSYSRVTAEHDRPSTTGAAER